MPNTLRLRRGTTAPTGTSFQVGEPAWDAANGKLYIKDNAGNMVLVGPGTGGGGTGSGQSFTFSATAPSSPAAGDEWFDSSSGILYRRINDGDSTAWVESGSTGQPGPSGATGDRGGVPYLFSNSIVTGDPGSGRVAFNSVVAASVTQLCISNLDQLGNTQTGWYNSWDDSTSAIEGYLTLMSASPSGTRVLVMAVTGSVTSVGSYFTVPVSYVSGTLPLNDEKIGVGFSRTGNVGTAAPKSVTIQSPSTAGEKIPLFYTTSAITVTRMQVLVLGSNVPSIAYSVRHGSDFSQTGTEVVTNGGTANSTGAGQSVTTFNNPSVAANSWIWVTTGTQSGTVAGFHLSLFF